MATPASAMEIENAGTTTEDGAGGAGFARGSDGSVKTKKPKDSAFKQQRLPAWQPILTAGTVLPTFFVIGFAFIPIGIGMLWFSDHVNELKIDYTDCKPSIPGENRTCAQLIEDSPTSEETTKCLCTVPFTLNTPWEGTVFMYYGLTNFYQNHRRYVKSRDDQQLLGTVKDSASDCEPFDKEKINVAAGDPIEKQYFPCGAIANSLFSDQITLKYNNDQVPLIRRGIAWDSDRKYKFKNPAGNLSEVLKDTLKPRDWYRNLWDLDPEDPDNNGLQNEDLIVWMRTAALPNFRKLYRKIDHNATKFQGGLPTGSYELNIVYRFKVAKFSGKKSIILSTTSILGGKNPFLGIAYITVGSICMLMGVVFLFIHIKCGKQTNDMMNITSRSPYN